MIKILKILAIASVAFSGFSASGSVILNLDSVDTGAAPGGTSPWLVATFTNDGPDAVLMTLTAPGLVYSDTTKEFVTKWAFNIDPALQGALTAANFAVLTPPTTNGLVWSIEVGADSTNLSPSFGYDFLLSFGTSNRQGGIERFENPDFFQARITLPGVSENSFAFLNTGSGRLAYSYAHVQGIASEPGSGKIYTGDGSTPPEEIPEPSTYALIAGGLGALAFLRRK